MSKYVVSYIDFFDNELTSTIIKADSELDSLIKYLEEYQNIQLDDKFEEVEEIKYFCFNCDAAINSIEI